jgi:hypothetical protein
VVVDVHDLRAGTRGKGVEQGGQADGDEPGRHERDENAQPRVPERDHETPADDDDGQDAGSDNHGVDDPVGQRVQPAQQLAREGDQRVAEQRLDQEQGREECGGGGEAQQVGGRPLHRGLGGLDHDRAHTRARNDRR